MAQRSLPNEPLIFQLAGFIDRQGRQMGRHRRINLLRALELDPRNTYTLQQLAGGVLFQRRYRPRPRFMDQRLDILPNDLSFADCPCRTFILH